MAFTATSGTRYAGESQEFYSAFAEGSTKWEQIEDALSELAAATRVASLFNEVAPFSDCGGR
jgi:hypothetical protein